MIVPAPPRADLPPDPRNAPIPLPAPGATYRRRGRRGAAAAPRGRRGVTGQNLFDALNNNGPTNPFFLTREINKFLPQSVPTSNYFIYPRDMLSLIYNHGPAAAVSFVDGRDNLNLRNIANVLLKRDLGLSPSNIFHYAYAVTLSMRRDPNRLEECAMNLLHRLMSYDAMVSGSVTCPRQRRYCKLYPAPSAINQAQVLPPVTDMRELEIPAHANVDLPNVVFGYILKRLADTVAYGNTRRSLRVAYQIDVAPIPPAPNALPWAPIYQDGSLVPVSVYNGYTSMKNVFDIWYTLMKAIANQLPGVLGNQYEWLGSVDSGYSFRFLDYANHHYIYVQLIFINVRGQQVPGKWTQKVEDVLSESVGTSVMSVRNRNDNKCLLYCLVMGLIMKFTVDSFRTFGKSTRMVEDSEVFTKALYKFPDSDPISELIRKLGLCLLPMIDYSNGSIDTSLYDYVKNLDAEVGTMLTIEGFREKFSEIEQTLIPATIAGVDVYGIDYNVNKHIYPLYFSKRKWQRDRKNIISLLCITPKDSETSHFGVIMNMEVLLKNSGGKQFFTCSFCGQTFYHRGMLQKHSENCSMKPRLNSGLVDEDGGYHYSDKYADPNAPVIGVCSKCRLAFTNDFDYEYHREHCLMQGRTGYRHVQLVTYDAKEESVLRGSPLDEEKEEKHVEDRRILYCDFECSINQETGEHTFMSYGLFDTKYNKYYCGYTIEELIDFLFTDVADDREEQIYVYFHNAMNYDANFILRAVLRTDSDLNVGIKVIMKSANRLQKLVFYVLNKDKKKRAIHIGDTFHFLTLSLERIVDSVRKDDLATNMENFSRFFSIFKQHYPEVSYEKIDGILKKNIFPYNFFDTAAKLATPIDEFRKVFEAREENLKYFSEKVTLEDLADGYLSTCDVITTFGCETAKDYHDLYLCCDVMQLADVFERSMRILWESHNIHLTRYIGMPSASWAAFLRHTPDLCIPLYENTFYAEFFKSMIRGGITSAALRYAKADDRHSIIYLDVNGLYPFVMQRYKYPCGKFFYQPFNFIGKEYCTNKLYEIFDSLEKAGNKGMCFCVDMHIPESVKRVTDMYPFAPEHRKIYNEYFTDDEQKEMTPFLKRWSEANDGRRMEEFEGLVCTLYDKEKYNVHWRLLKFYIEHGVEITKVHFGVGFDEGDYLASYIRKNIEIRNGRKDELGKTLYKLLGNSIYGKTFESPFKRNTYEIVRDETKLQGLIEEGSIAQVTPVDDKAWIVKFEGEEIVLDKPTYIGACVCEYAKLHMYTLLYDKLCTLFPECLMVYTDTDSFIVQVELPEGVEGRNPRALFDYIKSKDPELIGGIGGQVKSETGEEDTIDEVIALRSKVYCYKTTKGKIGKRAKGTTYSAQETQLNYDLFLYALHKLTTVKTKNVQFLRKCFKLNSFCLEKDSLSVNDGKRMILPDGIHTHAFGY